jgi:hypothetical protein
MGWLFAIAAALVAWSFVKKSETPTAPTGTVGTLYLRISGRRNDSATVEVRGYDEPASIDIITAEGTQNLLTGAKVATTLACVSYILNHTDGELEGDLITNGQSPTVAIADFSVASGMNAGQLAWRWRAFNGDRTGWAGDREHALQAALHAAALGPPQGGVGPINIPGVHA